MQASVNQPIGIKEYYKEPGFWMVSEITMMLHSGSHVDFTKHYVEDGETADDAKEINGRGAQMDQST